jgi:hypothetical protein
MTGPDRRAALIAGLRDLADFLEAHPDLPLPFLGGGISYHAHGTDGEARAEVDRIAAILDVPAAARDNDDHYEASRDFGGVAYRAMAVRQDALRRYTAHMAPYYKAERSLHAGTEDSA